MGVTQKFLIGFVQIPEPRITIESVSEKRTHKSHMLQWPVVKEKHIKTEPRLYVGLRFVFEL